MHHRGPAIIFLAIIVFLFSCVEIDSTKSTSQSFEQIPLKYSKGFSIFKKGDTYLLKVHSTTNEEDVFQEIYVDRKKDGDTNLLLFHLKAQRIIALSTTYLAFIEKLGSMNGLVGISNSNLIYSPKISQLVANGRISDVGNDQALNYESIIELKPDAILFYDFGPTTSATVKKLEGLGLNVILINEFSETSPLGKAEWIKFFGILLDKVALSNRIFDDIEKKYIALQEKAASVYERPSVFTGLPWKGEWYQPGGKSFQAAFIKDAGGKYLWEDDENVSGITIDREVVFDKAIDADIWLHPSNTIKLEDIILQDQRYGHFKSFKSASVYNNNLKLNESMGNDYWESGILNPHLILADLMAIFHPELMPDHKFTYYRKLN